LGAELRNMTPDGRKKPVVAVVVVVVVVVVSVVCTGE
jgi:hypothetical protein